MRLHRRRAERTRRASRRRAWGTPGSPRIAASSAWRICVRPRLTASTMILIATLASRQISGPGPVPPVTGPVAISSTRPQTTRPRSCHTIPSTAPRMITTSQGDLLRIEAVAPDGLLVRHALRSSGLARPVIAAARVPAHPLLTRLTSPPPVRPGPVPPPSGPLLQASPAMWARTGPRLLYGLRAWLAGEHAVSPGRAGSRNGRRCARSRSGWPGRSPPPHRRPARRAGRVRLTATGQRTRQGRQESGPRRPLEEDLQDRPWGLRIFRVLDPAGYYLRITGRGR